MQVETLPKKYVYFVHRPKFGMTLGFYPDGNTLFVAASMVNDGTNSESKLRRRPDQFSKKEARKRIIAKLRALVYNPEGETPLGARLEFPTEIVHPNMKNFMYAFRQSWKPDPAEVNEEMDPLANLRIFPGARNEAWRLALEISNEKMSDVKK